MDKNEFWQKHKELMLGTFYKNITEFPTFTFFESIFPQKSYNFIQPKNIDFSEAFKLIEDYKVRGVEISFYIDENELDKYSSELEISGYKNNGDDTWLAKIIQDKVNLEEKYIIELSDSNFEKYVEAVNICFPEYDNNREYCKACLDLNTKNKELNRNFILQVNDSFAAFASVVMNKECAYFHNDATLPEFRRQGLQNYLINYRSNYSFDKGVKVVYANTEENSGSYNSYLKSGFESMLKYFKFSK